MIDPARYTSGRIAVANLTATIDSLNGRRLARPAFDDLAELSRLLFLRGDLLGRIVDHNEAERVATEAVALLPGRASALYLRARLAARFHLFPQVHALLARAREAGHPQSEIDAEEASFLQATGHYREALVVRQRLVRANRGIDTLGALATLLAEMEEWAAAEACFADALDADTGVSPLPCGQLLFEWGVSAMRHGLLERAEEILAELEIVLPAHVPGRGHRAELALARGDVEQALALITPLLGASDDPEYRATYAEILAALGNVRDARREARLAAGAYEALLVRRPEAYADHAAEFYLGIDNQPQRALELAAANWRLRDTPRARSLLARAERNVERLSTSRTRIA